MSQHHLGKGGILRRVVTALIAVGALFHALPFSPEPLLVPAGGYACWFEPLDLCDPAGAFSTRLAEMPLLPPPSLEPAIRRRVEEVAFAAWWRLPDGFPPPVHRPPRRPC